MIVVGIHDAHDSSACILRDGKLVVAAMEERFQRQKGISTFPKYAIEACFQEAGLSYRDIDRVAIATKRAVPTNVHNIVGTFSIRDHLRFNTEYYKPLLYESRLVPLAEVFPAYKPKGEMFYPLEKVPFITTAEVRGRELEDLAALRHDYAARFFGIEPAKVRFFDHHTCHALHAVYSSPVHRHRVAVVTSDGGGDGTYESVHVFDSGSMTCLHRGRTSLIGKVYASVTLLLGMDPHRHPYKVMGLAPYASAHHKAAPRDEFLKVVGVDGLRFTRAPELKDFFFHFKNALEAYRFDGIAGGLQDFVEIRLREWFANIAEAAGTRDFVFGGGVANNTKANLTLMKSGIVDSLFVPAGPGDEGLSIGAAFHAVYDELGAAGAYRAIARPRTAYLGPNLNSDAVREMEAHPFIREHYDARPGATADDVAELLANGEIVALCVGGMEFGARALGHRSLIADPSNKETLRRLNDLIKKRDFWMPFAPSVLAECFDDYLVKPNGIQSWADVPADYMTLCFETTPLGRKHLSSAIHAYDLTARPQAVTRETCHTYHAIISAFRKKTGIGAVLNTSLNIHEKPIVWRPVEIADEILVDLGVPLNHILVNDTLFSRRPAREAGGSLAAD